MKNDNDVRETIRFNMNNPIERKMVKYLGEVKGKRKGAFIKEAMEMYIEAIEQGLYDCPFFKEEEEVESKFKNIVQEKLASQDNIEEDIFDIDTSNISFDNLDLDLDLNFDDMTLKFD